MSSRATLMRISRRTLRTLIIESILEEGFKHNKEELISLFPASENDIIPLGTKEIDWLINRFGRGGPKIPETHPFPDALETLMDFKSRETAIKAKWKSSEYFKEIVNQAYEANNQEIRWNNPTDITHMTSDELALLAGLSRRKKPRIEAPKKIYEPVELIGKVGPWNIWLPHTRADSIHIAGFDPITQKEHTSWCTARCMSSNLFYTYNRTGKMLFYVIRDDPLPRQGPNPDMSPGVEDYLAIGYKDGILIPGRSGGATIDREQGGLTQARFDSILGQYKDEIFKLIESKVKDIEGDAPSAKLFTQAGQDVNILKDLVRGLSKKETADELRMIYGIIADAKSKPVEVSSESAHIFAKYLKFTTIIDKPVDKVLNQYLVKNPGPIVESGRAYHNNRRYLNMSNAILKAQVVVWPENAAQIYDYLFSNLTVSADDIQTTLLPMINNLMSNQPVQTRKIYEEKFKVAGYDKIVDLYNTLQNASTSEEATSAYEAVLKTDYSSMYLTLVNNSVTPRDILFDILRDVVSYDPKNQDVLKAYGFEKQSSIYASIFRHPNFNLSEEEYSNLDSGDSLKKEINKQIFTAGREISDNIRQLVYPAVRGRTPRAGMSSQGMGLVYLADKNSKLAEEIPGLEEEIVELIRATGDRFLAGSLNLVLEKDVIDLSSISEPEGEEFEDSVFDLLKESGRIRITRMQLDEMILDVIESVI